jgi:hypothetical protein
MGSDGRDYHRGVGVPKETQFGFNLHGEHPDGILPDDCAPPVGPPVSPGVLQAKSPDKLPDAPLADYQVIGIETMPGGTCWHCGTAITVNVLAQHRSGGETITIGTTCAERIGLDPEGLKEYLKDRRDDIRNQRYAAEFKARQEMREREAAEAAAHELELDGKIGPHGTASRYEYGCRCDDCRVVAPHGTTDCFYESECSCDDCVAAALDDDPALSIDKDSSCLVDLKTGKVAPGAQLVRGQYGMSWLVPSFDPETGVNTGNSRFIPAFRKRRDTVTKKGFTYAKGTFVIRTKRYAAGDISYKKVRCLVQPTVDDWGEPIGAAPITTENIK